MFHAIGKCQSVVSTIKADMKVFLLKKRSMGHDVQPLKMCPFLTTLRNACKFPTPSKLGHP